MRAAKPLRMVLVAIVLGAALVNPAPPLPPDDFRSQDERVEAERARNRAEFGPGSKVRLPPRLDSLGLTREYLAACLGDRDCPGRVEPDKRSPWDPYITAWLAVVPDDEPARFRFVAETSPQVVMDLACHLPGEDLDRVVAALGSGPAAFDVAYGILHNASTTPVSTATGRWVVEKLVARWDEHLVFSHGETMMRLDATATTARLCADLLSRPLHGPGSRTDHTRRVLNLVADGGTTPGAVCASRILMLAGSPVEYLAWSAKKAAFVHGLGDARRVMQHEVDAALAADSSEHAEQWTRRQALEVLRLAGEHVRDDRILDWVAERALDPRLTPIERRSVLSGWLRGPARGCAAMIASFCYSLPEECEDDYWLVCPTVRP